MPVSSPAYYRERAYQILEQREHSVYELYCKLVQRGCPVSVADNLIDQLQSDGLLSDVRFGVMFVRSKLRQGWSAKRVEFELQKKHHISGETWLRVLEKYSEEYPEDSFDSDIKRAERIVQRRWHSANDSEKLFRYLVNRGFSVSCAKQVLQPYRHIADEARE